MTQHSLDSKLKQVLPPALFVFKSLDYSWFFVLPHVCIGLSLSPLGDFVGLVFNIQIILEGIDIFIVRSPLIYKQGISLFIQGFFDVF